VNFWTIGSKPMNKKLIIVVGPTAVGKTELSIELANEFKCPIISFDSRQFYQEMSIGTAKPSNDELAQASHHFIGSRSIHEAYTAGMYENEALSKLSTIFETSDYCIAVGGSGLYIDALVYGIDDIPANPEVRIHLQERWKNEGLEVLQAELKEIDPDYYAIADLQNPRRVVRALEVFHFTGKTFTELRKKTPKNRDFEVSWVGLNLDRSDLFDRIHWRVDWMVSQGLLEEARDLYPHKNLKALHTVGYSELFSHFDGTISLEAAIELIKRNTRHYAKRQITWFKKNEAVKWYLPSEKIKIIEDLCK
jgi:tRNA dimethylallyltransferase